MKLIIEDDEGRKTVIPLVREEISIGRLEGNTIRLTERNVSRKHARLFKQSGAIIIEDLGSSNGVRINGERISEKQTVRDGDLIEIGDYDLAIEGLPRSEVVTAPSLRLPSQDDTEITVPYQGPRETSEPLPPGQMPHLVGLSGPQWGEEHTLSRTIVSFGRAADVNDIAIDEPSVSRAHGKFKLEDGTWMIYDSQSSYGLRVNGDSVASAPLKPGDTIEIGETRFRFCAPGEEFSPPREYGATQVTRLPTAGGGSRPPIYAAIGAGVAVVVIAGLWFALKPGTKVAGTTTNIENHCSKAKSALDEKNWTEAVQVLQVAKQLGTVCPFSLDDALKLAQANQEVKHALDEVDGLLQRGKFKQVVESLAHVPADSPYSDAARIKVLEAKSKGVKQLSGEAQDALNRSRTEEAKQIILDLQSVDPDAPTLPFLQKQLADKEAAAPPRVRPTAAAPGATPGAPTPPTQPEILIPTAPPTPAPTADAPEDRTKHAKEAISAGIDMMKSGDYPGGEKKLQEAIALHPDGDTLALAHKNLGVAYARQKQFDDAVAHLKIYLKLKPTAPDRDRYEGIIKQIESGQK